MSNRSNALPAFHRVVKTLFLGILLTLTWANVDANVKANETPPAKSKIVTSSLLLDVTRAGDRLVAVGERGHILYSDDNGESWAQTIKSPVSVTLTAVTFPTPKMGWAVGHEGVILHSADGGETWVKQFDGAELLKSNLKLLKERYAQKQAAFAAYEEAYNELSEEEQQAKEIEYEDRNNEVIDAEFLVDDAQEYLKNGVTFPFLNVWFRTRFEGFAMGAYGQIVRTTNGGQSWDNYFQKVPNVRQFHYNAMIDHNRLLFMAGERGTIFRSANGGLAWEKLESPYIGSFFDILSVPNSDELIVFGLLGNAFRSTDNGQTWQRVNTTTDSGLAGGALKKNGELIFVGNDGAMVESSGNRQNFTVKFRQDRLNMSAVVEAENGNIVIAGQNGIRVMRADNGEDIALRQINPDS